MVDASAHFGSTQERIVGADSALSTEPEGAPDLQALQAAIFERARELGFALVRFARVEAMPETLAVLEERIDAGLLSGLTWFTRERARVASDPRNLMAAARTAVS